MYKKCTFMYEICTEKKLCKNCANARTKTQGDDVKICTQIHLYIQHFFMKLFFHFLLLRLLHFRFLMRKKHMFVYAYINIETLRP